MKHSGALAHLRLLCSLGLGAEAVVPALLRALRPLVPSDSGAFFWVDANGDMTHMYAERMLPAAVTQRYFKRHYEGAMHAFRARVLAQARAKEITRETCVDEATQASEYFREVLVPLGAFRTLHAVVQDHGAPLALLSLYRPQGAPAFTAAQREIVATLCRYLQGALRGAEAEAAATQFRESGEAALLVCADDGTVAQASGRGHALLAQASGCRINRYTMTGELEQAGRSLLRRVLGSGTAPRAATDLPMPDAQVVNEWGLFRLRAYPLASGYGVLIERHEHLLLRLVDAMRSLKLSAQQREVALLLARSLSNPQIARRLAISLNTASYHVKQLFAKLDAHDRAGVVARILEGHTTRH